MHEPGNDKATETTAFLRQRTRARVGLACGLFTLAIAAGFLARGGSHVSAASKTDATAKRTAYNEKVSAGYNDHFSADKHFLPSLMTTDTGEFIDPKDFPTAQYCGHCHKEVQHQWRESAHSNSNRAPWYLRNIDLLKGSKGVEYTRHCEGCHDPIAMVAGNLTQGSEKRRPFDADGVTCSVCHSIQKTDTRGTGSYVLAVPAVMVDEAGNRVPGLPSDMEIYTHLDRHRKAVMQPLYQSAEFCAACHKAALPRDLNDYKWQRAISLYDEWQNSSFAKQSPLPFYVKDNVSTCTTCHMQREKDPTRDPGGKAAGLASHRWLGANTIIPQNYDYPEQGQKIADFLKSNYLNVDIFAIEHGDDGKHVSAPLGAQPLQIKAGELLTADVIIQNKGIAHSLVPEQRDFYEAWVDFTVKDHTGKTLFESGYLQPDGDLDPRAHSFTNRLINPDGVQNREHQVWNNKIVAYNNTIQSGRSQLVRYTFHMPATKAGPVTLTATVRYRRFNQHFIDFGMKKAGADHYPQPVVDAVSISRTLSVGPNGKTDPLPNENPEWMRWNNYGIALLDAQQYAASQAAFQHVSEMRPTYADSYTNQAIAEFSWQRYGEAKAHLEKALTLAPGNARAQYYLALTERNLGDLDAAIALLRQVTASFPRSRDAHRELGFSLYQQHRYAEAKAEYLLVQGIDPDDLAAHYVLAILYRRLGDPAMAAKESAAFADQKDDPTANSFALAFLNDHPETANESVAWHTHELDAPLGKPKGPLPTTFSATQN